MQIIGSRADVLRICPEPNTRSLVVILEHLAYMYILLYYLFTDKNSFQESHVYLALLADVEVSSVSVYPEAHLQCLESFFKAAALYMSVQRLASVQKRHILRTFTWHPDRTDTPIKNGVRFLKVEMQNCHNMLISQNTNLLLII